MKADNAWSCKSDILETGVTYAPALNGRSALGCGVAADCSPRADSVLWLLSRQAAFEIVVMASKADNKTSCFDILSRKLLLEFMLVP